MRRDIIAFVAALTLTASFAFAPRLALAGILSTRAELMNLLGSSAVTDDFEGYQIQNGGVVNTQISYLDSQTLVNGNGPGLVHPGATYSFIRAPLTWAGANYNGIATKTIVSWNISPAPPGGALDAQDVKLFFAVLIQYASPVLAFGVDLWRFNVMGIVTIEIYDVYGTQTDELVVDIPSLGAPAFAGYSDPAGIGAIVVKNTKFPTYWSPSIDDHTYGTLAPTPTAGTSWGRIKTLFR